MKIDKENYRMEFKMKQWMLIACSILIVMFTYFVFILIKRRSAKKRANNLTPARDTVNSNDHSTAESMQSHSVNTYSSQAMVIPAFDDVTEATIIEVLAAVDDQVDSDTPLITLETDKVSMEVPAEFSGVVESIALKVGDVVSPGDVIGMVAVIGQAPADETSPVANQQKYQKRMSLRLYKMIYARSIKDDAFWAEQSRSISWIRPFSKSKIKDVLFSEKDVKIKWFYDGTLNACYNCIDRHLARDSEKKALIWVDDDGQISKTLTYQMLYNEVCRLANGLKQLGIEKGDRVIIYLPKIPEAIISMLACARIGAVHVMVFQGLPLDGLRYRIEDSQAKLIITADAARRGGKLRSLKATFDEACLNTKTIQHCVVINNLDSHVDMISERDVWYHDLIEKVDAECAVVEMNAEDPLFIMYTGGTRGKLNGLVYATGGYLVHTSATFRMLFNHPSPIFWCAVDLSFMSGHSYLAYGPLAVGATVLMKVGVPTYPAPSIAWSIIDRFHVTHFYTTAAAIRVLKAKGDQCLKQSKRNSLVQLGFIGGGADNESWQWCYDTVGKRRCPVIDTWWQVETGGIMLASFHGPVTNERTPLSPFFGIKPVVINSEGQNIETGEANGLLCFEDSWPGQARTIFGDHQRFINTYFSSYPGYYDSGESVTRCSNKQFRIRGRVDDVITVSGYSIVSEKIEKIVLTFEAVKQVEAVGLSHDIKGQAVVLFVKLKSNNFASEALKEEIQQRIIQRLGPIYKPETIHYTYQLTQTESGDVDRELLKKRAVLYSDAASIREKSPVVGTVYLSSKPGVKPYVNIGDRIEKGDVLCVIEAMKIFNNIQATYSGIVTARLVEDGQPVEFGQPLFIIRQDK
jgi:acetyl-CoA synthetase